VTPTDGTGATTVVDVEVDTATPRISALHLVAPEGEGLAFEQLPAIDLKMLLASVLPAVHAQDTRSRRQPAPELPASAAAQPPAVVENSATTEKAITAPPRAARAAGKSTTRKAPAAKTAKKPAPKKRTAAAPTAKSTKRARPTAAKSVDGTTPQGEGGESAATGRRNYRSMPADFADMFRQTSSAIALADHHQVPRYTAQGWITTARRNNLIPAAARRT
jgi:hypothetical protein